jgi:hypothetical protein
MTEFSNGIFKVIAGTSAGRAFVYTLGHIVIAMCVVSVVTGASLRLVKKLAIMELEHLSFYTRKVSSISLK